MVEKKTFYFAGKIQQNCWRHSIVADLGDYAPDSDWPILENSVFGMHNYSGPFFSLLVMAGVTATAVMGILTRTKMCR